MNTAQIAFIDIEGYPDSHQHRFGILYDSLSYTTSSATEVKSILDENPPQFICGHNFVEHDYEITQSYSLNECINKEQIIDTLALSMLFHPGKKTHKLKKPYRSEIQLENFPAVDCAQTKELLLNLEDDFHSLDSDLRTALHKLLQDHPLYKSFFTAMAFKSEESATALNLLEKKSHLTKEKLNSLIAQYPVECGIICSQLYGKNKSTLSRIILERYPELPRIKEEILFDISKVGELVQKYSEDEFGFSEFREFPTVQQGLFTLSQRTIIEAAVRGESFLCVLPTGGGKTFTFQLPAIIKADLCKTLTVVISPLQALMKNHTDNFNSQIENFKSAALSGFLDPISRINTLEEIHNGTIDILYLAPEALRSNTVFKALQSRVIERFVIDEAHCFSAWGHDFRHDYFYIRECITELQKSTYQKSIPVSCFTATARPQVLDDISFYFEGVLNEKLQPFVASSERSNLSYSAISVTDDTAKYNELVKLLVKYNDKSIIIYRPQNAKGCKQLAEKLAIDNRLSPYDLVIEPFYAKMDEDDDRPDGSRSKNEVLDDFISDKVNVVIATTAFGMGIDKPNIEAVIHYDPSDSLESYMQESGRGARSSNLHAECIVLYTDKDFLRIFQNHTRSKLQYDEIDRIAKHFRKNKQPSFQCTTRSVAKAIGIDPEETRQDYDTLVKTAILELEKWGIIKRGRNQTKIYATSILNPSNESNILPMDVVHQILDPKREQYENYYEMMIVLMQNIIQKSKTDPVEVETLAEIVGIPKKDIFEILLILQKEKLLEYHNDISVFIDKILVSKMEEHFSLEKRLLQIFKEELRSHKIDLRAYREDKDDSKWFDRAIGIILSWKTMGPLVQEKFEFHLHKFICSFSLNEDSYRRLVDWTNVRKQICRIVSDHCLSQKDPKEFEYEFSSNELFIQIASQFHVDLSFYHHCLVFIHNNIKGFKIHRGRLLYYQGIRIQKQEPIYSRSVPYYKDEYKESLERYYQNKIEAIHILQIFYENLEKDGWASQREFVMDYFGLDYKSFIKKYKLEQELLKLAITEEGAKLIRSDINEEQMKIVDDKTSRAILVLAGPGSGKTKTLVHKIASLITLENNKPDYFLMLTHSRVAAKEFKTRLFKLIGPVTLSVEIMTFHAYASLITGDFIETQDDLQNLIPKAIGLIEKGKFKPKMKTMLVLDEFQDIGENMYEFIRVIYEHMSKDRKIIAVGDDDQCINNFGNDMADPIYMEKFLKDFIWSEEDDVIPVTKYSLLNNYRSDIKLVSFTNDFARRLENRQKEEDLIPIAHEPGHLTLTEYSVDEMEDKSYLTRMAKEIGKDPSKNIAVLLRTNDEVLSLYSMLKLQGCTVQYIMNREGFNLGNLMELQDFFSDWQDYGSYTSARTEFDTHFIHSKNYNLACQVIEDFISGKELEELNKNSLIHCQDLSEHLKHIQFDEYLQTDSHITVSTMHKSKGREFDTIYAGINGHNRKDRFAMRLFYVAMTRAKHNLHLHCSSGSFKNFIGHFDSTSINSTPLLTPNRIAISMNLGDLWLSNTYAHSGILNSHPIAGEKIAIRKIKSGDKVKTELRKEDHLIGVLSKPAKKGDEPNCAQKLLDLEAKGYTLETDCEIENVVYWINKDDENRKWPQVLCQLVLKKQK